MQRESPLRPLDALGALLERPTRGGLVAFHTRHKLLLLAHSPARYRSLGRLVGTLAERPLGEVMVDYAAAVRQALAEPTTRGRQVNVLEHAAGYFKRLLAPSQRAELARQVADFQAGRCPLAVPLTLLRHHVAEYAPRGWLAAQVYLQHTSLEETR